MENLFGLAPNVPDLPATGVLHGMLTGGAFEVRFIRSTAAVVPYKVEWSTDPGNSWTHAVNGQNGVSISTVPLPDNKEEVTVSIPQNGAARLFARVNAG